MAKQFPPEWYAHQAARRKNKNVVSSSVKHFGSSGSLHIKGGKMYLEHEVHGGKKAINKTGSPWVKTQSKIGSIGFEPSLRKGTYYMSMYKPGGRGTLKGRLMHKEVSSKEMHEIKRQFGQ